MGGLQRVYLLSRTEPLVQGACLCKEVGFRCTHCRGACPWPLVSAGTSAGVLATPATDLPASAHIRRPVHLCLLSPHTPATHTVLMEPENMPTYACAYAILCPNSLCIIGKLRPPRGRDWFRAQFVGRRGFPAGSAIKNSPASAGDAGNAGSVPELGRFPWRRKWQPMPVFLPGESHGQKRLAGCSP